MTTSEWRTDRPDVGRFIRQPCGSLLHVGCEVHADHIASGAVTHPAHLAWQYIDPSPEMVAAAELGAAYAGLVLFIRRVVPLGFTCGVCDGAGDTMCGQPCDACRGRSAA